MRLRRTISEEPGFQMMPMIDVVFQLLIFFMCVSTFSHLQAEEDIKLPVADHSQKKETSHNEIIINVRGDGMLVLDQKTYHPYELADVLTNTKTKFGEPIVTIRADKGVPHGKVLDVLSACAYADIWDISFATYKEEPSSYREGG